MNSNFIWIVGNMGSGKTTACRKLVEILPTFTYLNIDDFRIKYNQQRTRDGEELAINSMEKAIHSTSNILLDSVGTWGYFAKYRNTKTVNPIKIYFKCDKSVAMDRIKQRLKNPIQVPFVSSDNSIETYSKNYDLFEYKFKGQYEEDVDLTIDTSALNYDQALSKVVDFLSRKAYVSL